MWSFRYFCISQQKCLPMQQVSQLLHLFHQKYSEHQSAEDTKAFLEARSAWKALLVSVFSFLLCKCVSSWLNPLGCRSHVKVSFPEMIGNNRTWNDFWSGDFFQPSSPSAWHWLMLAMSIIYNELLLLKWQPFLCHISWCLLDQMQKSVLQIISTKVIVIVLLFQPWYSKTGEGGRVCTER